MRWGTLKYSVSLSAFLSLLTLFLVGCGGGSPPAGTVEGVVVDATDPSVPIENAYCYIPFPPVREGGGGRQEIIEDYTDAEGRYRLDNVPVNQDLPLIVEPTPDSSMDFVRMELSVRVTAAEPTIQEVAVVTPAVFEQITGLAIQADTAVMLVGQTRPFAATVTGYTGPLRFTWWVTGGVGTIDRNGLFRATRQGTGAVHVGVGTLEDQATVIVVTTAPQGRIAFASERDGNLEVYVMNPDGTNQTNLTNNLAQDWSPSWSPDANKIVFASNRDGNDEIYVMNSNGTNQTRLTNNLAAENRPSWSPDGSKIAFVSDRDGNLEVYAMNPDGSAQTNLTNNPADEERPSWSPDGTKIAFYSDRDGNAAIYVMNPDGTTQTRLTSNPAGDVEPSWSPDGSKIAFVSFRDGNAEVYVMNAPGTSQINLTNNPAPDWFPSWSPDGRRIAFYSFRNDNWGIYVMNSNGTNQVSATTDPAIDSTPSWSPF